MNRTDQWEEELRMLREINQKTDLVETNKWGGEVYTINNKNVLGIGGFSLYKQKEFWEFMATAKQEKTKITRLEKIRPMIMEGTGLNDKYRKQY